MVWWEKYFYNIPCRSVFDMFMSFLKGLYFYFSFDLFIFFILLSITIRRKKCFIILFFVFIAFWELSTNMDQYIIHIKYIYGVYIYTYIYICTFRRERASIWLREMPFMHFTHRPSDAINIFKKKQILCLSEWTNVYIYIYI